MPAALNGCSGATFIGAKVGAVKALLWAMGVNDDDRFHITAKPGPPINMKERGAV